MKSIFVAPLRLVYKGRRMFLEKDAKKKDEMIKTLKLGVKTDIIFHSEQYFV